MVLNVQISDFWCLSHINSAKDFIAKSTVNFIALKRINLSRQSEIRKIYCRLEWGEEIAEMFVRRSVSPKWLWFYLFFN